MTPIQMAAIAAAVLFVIAVVVVVVILKRRKTTPECVPDCEGKCGGVDDGCGGACNGCSDGKNCLGTVCGIRPPCVPKCEGKCGEAWDGCVKRGVKGKCPKDCGANQTCRNKTCFKTPTDPKKAGCTQDSECDEFKDKGLTFCNKWSTPRSCVSPICNDNSDCPDPNKMYCSPSKECVSDPCEGMLGKDKWIKKGNRCFPKCSSDQIKRTNTGWCMESDQSFCPQGWELKEVIGNANGRGNKVVSKACIPVTDRPFEWIKEDGNIIRKNLPQCSNPNPEYREEGWCIENEDEGNICNNSYIKFTSSEGMGSYWGKQNYIDYCAPITSD